MIQHLLPRACDFARARSRRALRILPALVAVSTLLSVPDAAAASGFGVTSRAVPDAVAARVGPLFEGVSTTVTSAPPPWCAATTAM
ncbi:hypothetical protein GCM10020254_71220 [Streptomyces goshikiensis]